MIRWVAAFSHVGLTVFFCILAVLVLIMAILFLAWLTILKNNLTRQKPNDKRRKKAKQRAESRPRRYSDEGKKAFERAQRFMLKEFVDYPIGLAPEKIRYHGRDIYIEGKYNRGKPAKKLKLYAQTFCCTDLQAAPSQFSAQEVLSSEVKNGKKWALIVHGNWSQSLDMLCEAYFFMERGYNVLLPDLRGFGKSEGAYVGMGWHDRLDIVAWTQYLADTYADCKILLYGVSMGASAVFMATGEKLCPNVRLAIGDCAFSSAWDEFIYQLKKNSRLPPFPLLQVADWMLRILYGYSLKQASAERQLEQNHTVPVLILHGQADRFVPAQFSQKIFDAAAVCDKELLFLADATHCESMRLCFETYWEKVDIFLKKYF